MYVTYVRLRDFKRGKGRLEIARTSTHHMYDSIVRGLSVQADGGARNQDGVTTGRSFSEGSFVRSFPRSRSRSRGGCEVSESSPGSSRLRGSSRPREGRAPRGRAGTPSPRGPPRNAAGAGCYIDCCCGLPIFKMARGGTRSKSKVPVRTPPRFFDARKPPNHSSLPGRGKSVRKNDPRKTFIDAQQFLKGAPPKKKRKRKRIHFLSRGGEKWYDFVDEHTYVTPHDTHLSDLEVKTPREKIPFAAECVQQRALRNAPLYYPCLELLSKFAGLVRRHNARISLTATPEACDTANEMR